MAQVQEAALSPETVLEEMKKNGVTDVVWLPDSETNWLYLLMKADPELRLIAVSREGHAFSTAAGLAVGGKTPVILIQNTGLMESGDSLRGWALGLNIPVVLMVAIGAGRVMASRRIRPRPIRNASSTPLGSITIWWKITPMPRGSRWRSKRPNGRNARSQSSSAMSITALSGRHLSVLIRAAMECFSPSTAS
jgi:hypothetical protein